MQFIIYLCFATKIASVHQQKQVHAHLSIQTGVSEVSRLEHREKDRS